MKSLLGNDGRVLLTMLILTVGFVILIACANVANMLMARATVRAREMSVRAALGAGRHALVAQLLTESLAVSVVSAAVGFGFAKVLLDALVRIANGTEDVFNMAHLDGRVLGFTVLVALVAPLAFGLFPALHASRVGATGALREGRSTGGNRAGRRARNVLAGAQVALALSLMIVAGLLTRTVMNLALRDPGIRTHGMVAVEIDISDGSCADDAARIRFYEAARRRRRSRTSSRRRASGNSGASAWREENFPPRRAFPRWMW
jgi:predicted lysophospholipase L1 biosynthesis ABC-type transport system permease subunit